ncbi:hypothetical protein Clacol_001498 [Clathrus columnatus]|uniref:Cora-domain-containing protein n=1 Tax=Clathrus columnatus TaxID=1419009 RepID=A0AAV5A250_9AGAM|nr:hypothetical protein Clacol_001498 [Clathrus columnatus]
MSMDEDEQRQSPGRLSVTRTRSMSVNPINTDPPLSTSQRNMSDMEQLGPRLSPSHTRQNIDPNDPDARERQRTMDVDIAMQMSRARRGSASVPIPPRQLSLTSTSNTVPSPIRGSPDQVFSFLPPHEEEIIPTVGSGVLAVDQAPSNLHIDDDTSDTHRPFNLQVPENSTSNVLYNLNQAGRDTIDHPNALPMYQATIPRSNFDFAHMEQFCAEEKPRLGLRSPTEQRTLFSRVRSQDQKSIPRSSVEVSEPVLPLNGGTDDAVPERPASPETARVRHRKISQSATVQGTRRSKIGKLALFEGNVGSDGIFGAPVPSFIHANEGRFPSGPSGWNLGSSMGQGHERPYRFSFYSNALLATIHARSLSELPAEGQSFEDLFLGVRNQNQNEDQTNTAPPTSNRPPRTSTPATATKVARVNSPVPANNSNHGNEKKDRSTDGPVEEDWEGNTWWLDVLNPTDEEMKMLSKVFSIHPLTTEDIQMEEAREKIELFRNYYLVCFRSFDQDQYSPTYLEPVNIEGTLSFHFRPTPHPQNVRRRITQLKDYINVTSDWISYALIDDITDAFGPLIQSIEYEVDSIDELVLILKEAEQSDMLRRIGTCRKKVMGLLRLMGNKADVVKGLAKRCNENWSVAPKSDIGLYLSDIQDHLITMTQNLNHYEKILSRSHSNYLAQISIEMTDANNQINDVLSKLTALGTVLIPMNLITGLWGMNVHVPGQDDQTVHFSILLPNIILNPLHRLIFGFSPLSAPYLQLLS